MITIPKTLCHCEIKQEKLIIIAEEKEIEKPIITKILPKTLCDPCKIEEKEEQEEKDTILYEIIKYKHREFIKDMILKKDCVIGN